MTIIDDAFAVDDLVMAWATARATHRDARSRRADFHGAVDAALASGCTLVQVAAAASSPYTSIVAYAMHRHVPVHGGGDQGEAVDAVRRHAGAWRSAQDAAHRCTIAAMRTLEGAVVAGASVTGLARRCGMPHAVMRRRMW